MLCECQARAQGTPWTISSTEQGVQKNKVRLKTGTE